jgi:Bacterial Ig-like domain (group 3)
MSGEPQWFRVRHLTGDCSGWKARARRGNRHRLRPLLLELEVRRLLSTFTVNSTADNGSTGTLRWAVGQADVATTPSTINFSPTVFDVPQTITLSGSQLVLSNTAAPVTITGPAVGVTVSGGGKSQILQIDASVTVSITGWTLTDGDAGTDGFGGGVLNYGAVSLSDCIISGNTASKGGGLFNEGSSANLSDCAVDNNSGSGVFTVFASLDMTDCTIGGNSGFAGGGLYSGGSTDTVQLTDCTISGNSATEGGGLCNAGPVMELTGCTIAGNTGGPIIGSGHYQSGVGGLLSEGELTLTECTISGNYGKGAGCAGLGIYYGTATLTGTIVAGNDWWSAPAYGDGDLADPGDKVTGSYNLIGTTNSTALKNGVDGNIVGVTNPGLGALGDYGGPTETMPVLPGSPALHAGTSVKGVTGDERGFPIDSAPDIGAFQSQPAIVVNTTVDGETTSPGELDLRQAVNLANVWPVSSAISFASNAFGTAQTITLTGGQLALDNTNGTMTITGPKVGVTVSGGGMSRVFEVEADVSASISGLTLTGGDVNNTGEDTDGGALICYGATTMSACTITGNSAQGGGGGVAVYGGGTAVLSDCTISGNMAARGGGLYNDIDGTLALVDCTVTGNSAASGGGLYGDSGGAMTLTDTIVAANTRTDGEPSDVIGTAAAASRYNLIGTGGSGGIEGGTGGNIVLTTLARLGLAPLENYGGPTPTVALLPGSAAIGAGSDSIPGVSLPDADQRGEPLDTPVPDIGAFQNQGFTLTIANGSTPQSTMPGTSFSEPLEVVVTADDAGAPAAGGVLAFGVSPAPGGASATLSAASVTIASNGIAEVNASANAIPGSFTVTATTVGGVAPAEFHLTNDRFPLTFMGLSNHSVEYGRTSVTFAGTLSDGAQAPQGGTVAAILAGVTQDAPIGSSGAFTTTFDPAALTVSGSPYTIEFAYAGDATFAAATSSCSLFITQATPVINISDPGSTNTLPVATVAGVVNGVATDPGSSLEGVALLVSYYTGTYTTVEQLKGLSPLLGAPHTVGSYTLLADFPGSADYTSASALADFTLTKNIPQITWSSPASIVYGTPLGLLQLDASTNVPGTFTYTPVAGTILSAGSGYTLMALFTPQNTDDYTTVTASTTVDVAKATPAIAVTATGGIFTGGPFLALVTVSGVVAGADNRPAGSLEGVTPSVTYYAGSGTSSPMPGDAPPTVPGTYTVVAFFPGSADYMPVSSQPVTLAIGEAASAVTLAIPEDPAVYGQQVRLVAAVEALGQPGGAVTFHDGATVLGTVALDSTYRAFLAISNLPAGNQSITAVYSGDADLLAGSSGPLAIRVNPASTDVVVVAHPVDTKKKRLASVEITAEIEPVAPGGGTPSGTVALTLTTKKRKKTQTKTLGTVMLSGGGATFVMKPKSVLNKTITVVYGGSSDFQPSAASLAKLTKQSLARFA